jgi:hypothetical protein
MLVQAPNGRYITLFPMWPHTYDASFTRLLTKGAFEVSASWSAEHSQVSNVTVTSLTGAPCTLLSPWGSATSISVTCGGNAVKVTPNSTNFAEFSAPAGVACSVSPI